MQFWIISFPLSTVLYRLHSSSMPALHPGWADSIDGRIEVTLSNIIVNWLHIELWTYKNTATEK
jgi:hypothetical protein